MPLSEKHYPIREVFQAIQTPILCFWEVPASYTFISGSLKNIHAYG